MKYVYLINLVGTDFYKIGFTKHHPEKRLKTLQTGTPMNLELIKFFRSEFASKIEASLHNQLQHKKFQKDDFNYLKGEWFEFGKSDVDNFIKMCTITEKAFNTLASKNN